MRSKRRPRKLRRHGSSYLPLVLLTVAMGIAAVTVALKPDPGPTSEVAKVEQSVQFTAEPEMVMISTPTQAIRKGQRLGDVKFATIKWPKSRLSDDFLRDIAGREDAIAQTALPKYLPVPLSALSDGPVVDNVVVEKIPEGMRAVTVRVDSEGSVEGWARSGTHVDVVLITAAKRGEGLEAKVIAENVRILSAGHRAAPERISATSGPSPKTVTLLVTTEDALKIKAASSLGKLDLILRGYGDDREVDRRKVTGRDLVGGPRYSKVKKNSGPPTVVKDASGQLYTLDDEGIWIKTTEVPAGVLAPERFVAREHDAADARAKLADENVE